MDSDSESDAHSDSQASYNETFGPDNPRPELVPSVGAAAIRQLTVHRLSQAGFQATRTEPLEQLEGLMYTLLESLIEHAHELAAHSRRNRPNLQDLICACEELGLGDCNDLMREISNDKSNFEPLQIVYDKKRAPASAAPRLSLADPDEGLEPKKRLHDSTNSLIADYLPNLPEKHAWKSTPVFPELSVPRHSADTLISIQQKPSAAALAHVSTLRSRLNDSQQVAGALRNLIRSTRGTTKGVRGVTQADEVDIVNYEAVGHRAGKRLKWKV